jgi:signal transduction histidine kinase
MTDAAERLARGELGQPIPAAGEDEIARLARALERLRLALEGDERRSLLLKHVITAQEDERRRIARELHDQTTALYRFAQEALTNVARHAGAETVLIACTVANGRIMLEIEDDGKGFDPEPTMRPRETGEGLGLLGMRERIALVGGDSTIESEPSDPIQPRSRTRPT